VLSANAEVEVEAVVDIVNRLLPFYFYKQKRRNR